MDVLWARTREFDRLDAKRLTFALSGTPFFSASTLERAVRPLMARGQSNTAATEPPPPAPLLLHHKPAR